MTGRRSAPRPTPDVQKVVEKALRTGIATGNWSMLLAIDTVRLWQRGELPEEGVLEVQFHETRKWRFDVAFKKAKLAVEIDGGGFIRGGGRHSRGLGIEKDCEKFAEAMMRGWRVLRVTPRQVKTGLALEWIRQLLNQFPATDALVAERAGHE